ncbi:MAG TPA: DUF6159 family protein [Thermoleophilaceae bacterium]
MASAEHTEPTTGRGLVQYARDGWAVGGVAFNLARSDRGLRRYALRAFVAVILIEGVMGAVVVTFRHHGTLLQRIVFGGAATYVIALASNAAAVGLAGVADDLLAGRRTEPAAGLRLARRRLPQIAAWALIVVIVGIPMRAATRWGIDQLAAVLLGFSWAIVLLFVIPAIALAGDGPVGAAKRSVRVVGRKWGTQLVGVVYVWIRPALFVGVPGLVAAVAGFVLARNGVDLLGWALAAAGVVTMAVAYLLAICATAVLAVALFRFAETGSAPAGFAEAQLERIMRPPSSIVQRVASRLDGDRARRFRARITDER